MNAAAFDLAPARPLKPGEDATDALRRELREELAFEVGNATRFGHVSFGVEPAGILRLVPYDAFALWLHYYQKMLASA